MMLFPQADIKMVSQGATDWVSQPRHSWAKSILDICQWIGLMEILQETPYTIGKPMVSCRFSLESIHLIWGCLLAGILHKYMINVINSFAWEKDGTTWWGNCHQLSATGRLPNHRCLVFSVSCFLFPFYPPLFRNMMKPQKQMGRSRYVCIYIYI